MATTTKKKSGRTNQTFAKGVKVIIIDEAHVFKGLSGTTLSDAPDEQGEYSIKVVNPDTGIPETTYIHADKLELHPDEEGERVSPFDYPSRNFETPTIHIHVNEGKGEDETTRDYTIKEATLKEDVCNYGYEVTDGPNHGDFHAVKGSGIIDDDLRHAFGRLHVHMAALDSAFTLSGIEVENIDDYHGHELAFRYLATSFKINGDGESVTLKGNKYSPTSGARIELTIPKVALDNLSSYPFAAQLKTAMDALREEVALYKEGKYTAMEQEDKPNSKQLTIGDALEQAKGGDNEDGDDEDFENGRV